jgi:hypothetical protein
MSNQLTSKEKFQTEFDICLSLNNCFLTLNRVFKQNGLDIKLKVESYIIPDTLEESHDRVIPLKQ